MPAGIDLEPVQRRQPGQGEGNCDGKDKRRTGYVSEDVKGRMVKRTHLKCLMAEFFF